MYLFQPIEPPRCQFPIEPCEAFGTHSMAHDRGGVTVHMGYLCAEHVKRSLDVCWCEPSVRGAGEHEICCPRHKLNRGSVLIENRS
jgi:hypothetical protein